MTRRSQAIHIPERLREELAAIAHETGRDFTDVVDEMIEEGVRMRRVRGIWFANELRRREAKVFGTGLGVWEVIEGYVRAGEDWEEFKREMDWLSEFQLRQALDYWRAYPDEVNELMARNASWTEEKLYSLYPWAKPPHLQTPNPDSPGEA